MELLAPYGSYARRHQSEDTIGLLRDRMVARTRSNFEVVCVSRVGLIDLHRSARLNNPRDFHARCSIRQMRKFTPSIETRNVMLAGVHSAGADDHLTGRAEHHLPVFCDVQPRGFARSAAKQANFSTSACVGSITWRPHIPEAADPARRDSSRGRRARRRRRFRPAYHTTPQADASYHTP